MIKDDCSFILVPEWNAAFKIKEDCHYEKVVFMGKEIGMEGKIDKENELIGILLCCVCDPGLEIIEISAEDYHAILKEVNLKRTI